MKKTHSATNFLQYLLPDMCIDDVTGIDCDALRELNVRAVLLDVDNTIVDHGSAALYCGISEWVARAKSFGICVMIISNCKGGRVRGLAQILDVDYILDARKPLGAGYTQAAKMLNLHPCEILAVGDQIFTDILGANFAGMRSALVKPQCKNEPAYIKAKRCLELPVRMFIRHRNRGKGKRVCENKEMIE